MNAGFYGWGGGQAAVGSVAGLGLWPGVSLTPPPALSAWTWANQGAATAEEAPGAIYLQCPAVSGDNVRGIFRNLPTAPWTITALIVPRLQRVGVMGLDLRQSSNDKHSFFGVASTATIHTWTYTNFTTWSGGEYASFTPNAIFPCWLRIADDGTGSGTARTYQTSTDGQHWYTLASVGHTDFLTPDQVGLVCNPGGQGNTVECGITLLSWTGA